MEKESRKSPRLPHYNYASDNYYFVTICTANKECIFGNPRTLNWKGIIVKKHIESICDHYSGITVDKYVVMPNHVHLIVVLGCNPESSNNTKLNTVIGQLKSGISREIHEKEPNMVVWQRSFHDHVIRNQKAYEKIWLYIDSNPQLWDKDCFYIDDFDW